MERKDVPLQQTWRVEDIFESSEAWEQYFAETEPMIDFSRFQGTLHTAEGLLAFYRETDRVGLRLEHLYVYALMVQNTDTRNSESTARLSRAGTLFNRFGANISFAEPELLALPEEQLRAYASDPALQDYDYQIKQLIASKAHILSQSEERIMALSSNALGSFQEVFSMIDNADLDLPKIEYQGEEVQLTHGLYLKILGETDRAKREETFKAYYNAYAKLGNTIAANYYGKIKSDVFVMQARKYASCLEKALSVTDVDPKVYENLMESVEENLSVMHDYIKYRKSVLGLDEQHMYDIYMPIVSAKSEISLPYDEAYAYVVEALGVLGKEYQALLQKAHDERWIDVVETAGKRSGAYSISLYDVHPYALLNYQPTTKNLFTIAHEMGHSLHSYLSDTHQPYAKAGYRIFVAEVASTVNEVLMFHYILQHADNDEIKKYVLNYHLDQLRTTLFRQTQFAMFEYKAHHMVEEGTPLTKQNLYELYYDLNRKFYGDGIVHDPEIGYEWSRIPHFYTAFYVYQYSTGIISAISIANRILTEGEGAVQDYFKFLSAGGSASPVEILKIAGVDLTSKAPFETAMQDFADTLAQLKKING